MKNVNALQVQSTNDASIISKCSTANKNYIKDDYLKYFVEKEKTRASLIHLGYYARAVIFSEVLVQYIKFLRAHDISKFQIVSCGSGFDTTYWRLAENKLLDNDSIFVEIDYANVINRKLSFIKKSEKLSSVLNIGDTQDGSSIKKLNNNYYLLCGDLCDLGRLEKLFKEIKIDFSIPTLFLSECVVTYMKEKDSNGLIQWIRDKFENSCFINYEQIHPEDGFGSVMLKHFDSLQSTLHSVLSYPDCESHKERYKNLGFEKSIAISEWDLLNVLTSPKERERVLALEQFDEFEEFHLKCTHYVLAIGANNFLAKWIDEINIIEPWLYDDKSIIKARFDVEETREELELFGHCSCLLRDGTVLIFGGFGRKGRSKRVFRYRNEKLDEISVTGNLALDMIHGCAVTFALEGKVYIGLYGGRTSPDSVSNSGEFLILEYNENGLKFEKSLPCGSAPRYRHSAVCQTSVSNQVFVWVLGGRTPDLKENLPELWEFAITKNEDFSIKCSVISANEAGPCCRMSHSAVNCPEKNAMYVSCGVDKRNFSVLNDLWKFSFDDRTWEEIKPECGSLLPRYGHSSHIRGSILYLLGGVNTTSGYQPGLALFDLNTFHVVELKLEPFSVEPLLLFNHASVLFGDGRIVVFGGGGNCFSFGTHFNRNIRELHSDRFRNIIRASVEEAN